MNKELIINSTPYEVNIVLLEDKQLVELHNEKSDDSFTVGDVYLGRVKKLVQGLNAAFIDVGYGKDAFLHYFDLGVQIKSLNKYIRLALAGKSNQLSMDNFVLERDIEKAGKITSVLNSNQFVLVQIVKEPISTKGARVSSEIAFAGRFLVLVPFSERISISQKIKDSEERNRLKRLVQSIKPKNFGVIIRTVAENKKVADLDADLNDLVERWNTCANILSSVKAPQKIIGELNLTTTLLRDILNESFNNIYVNDLSLFEDIKNYIKSIAPEKVDIIKSYTGKVPIFEFFGIEKQIKRSFGKTVTMKNGAYLVIEHTEALHVIDVNSGHMSRAENNQESNALEANLEAAGEIARQLRLRDMGGIIVIDFIDMKDSTNRRKLYERIKDAMKTDRAKHTILPPNKFGLVQITRQRVRPEMNIDILETCPSCSGSGKIKPSIMLIEEIEENIKYLIRQQNERRIKLNVHPYIHAYLTKGILSIRFKWSFKLKKRIHIHPMPSYNLLEYHFSDKNDNEIKL